MDLRTVSLAGAVSLAVGPLAPTIPLTVTDETAPVTDHLAAYAAHAGTALAGNLILVPLMLLVPAVVCAARLARRGVPRPATASMVERSATPVFGAPLWASAALAAT